jgi:hypothetical protein
MVTPGALPNKRLHTTQFFDGVGDLLTNAQLFTGGEWSERKEIDDIYLLGDVLRRARPRVTRPSE